MSDQMKNSSSPIGGGKTPGLKETLEWYNEYDMNVMNDPIGVYRKKGTASGK